jgi:hypothetical protein
LYFAVIENCIRAFHISEGTGFKLSTLSFAYLHRFSYFITFGLLFIKESGKKNHPCVYVGEGFETRPFWIFSPSTRPTCLGMGLQIGKGLFSKPSPRLVLYNSLTSKGVLLPPPPFGVPLSDSHNLEGACFSFHLYLPICFPRFARSNLKK